LDNLHPNFLIDQKMQRHLEINPLNTNGKRAIFSIYCIILALEVLTPHSVEPEKFLGLFYVQGPIEWLINIFLLTPLAYLMPVLWKRLHPMMVLATCAAVSISIELLQRWIPARMPSIQDFLLNVASCGLVIWIRCKGKENKGKV